MHCGLYVHTYISSNAYCYYIVQGGGGGGGGGGNEGSGELHGIFRLIPNLSLLQLVVVLCVVTGVE